MRRKPLALLCFLLSRPGMSATRDQVLDALWPDNDPDQAVNSLHQTVYFLRRIIEPAYSDDLSPGYINQDTELVWLDPELIASRSVRCREQMRALGPDPSVPAVLALATEYRGRFALDFSYDDWASMHRESLHAQYLEVMERAIAVEHGGRPLRRGDGAVQERPRDRSVARPDRGQPREDVPPPRSARGGGRAVPALHGGRARRARDRAAPS